MDLTITPNSLYALIAYRPSSVERVPETRFFDSEHVRLDSPDLDLIAETAAKLLAAPREDWQEPWMVEIIPYATLPEDFRARVEARAREMIALRQTSTGRSDSDSGPSVV